MAGRRSAAVKSDTLKKKKNFAETVSEKKEKSITTKTFQYKTEPSENIKAKVTGGVTIETIKVSAATFLFIYLFICRVG